MSIARINLITDRCACMRWVMNKEKGIHARLAVLMAGERPYTWAKKVGISKGLFQYYWQRGHVPSYRNLLKIREYTGCSLDWLLTGEVPFGGALEKLPLSPLSSMKDRRQQRYKTACRLMAEIHSKAKSEEDLGALAVVLKKFAAAL